MCFRRCNQQSDTVGFIDEQTQAIFGRSHAAAPELLVAVGVGPSHRRVVHAAPHRAQPAESACNSHVIESVLARVASALGWR